MKNVIFGILFVLSIGIVAGLIAIRSTPTVVANEAAASPTTTIQSEVKSAETQSAAVSEAEVTQLHKDTLNKIDNFDGLLWSTTVPVKGIKREPYLATAEKAMANGEWAAAKTYLDVVNRQILLAQEQADDQANGGWEAEASFLLGTK